MNVANLLSNRYRVTANPLLTERRIELTALLLTVVLLLQLLYSVARFAMSAPPESILPASDSLLVSELQRAGLVSAQQSNDLRARPVFWPSRRPVDASAEDLAAAENSKAGKSELDKVKLVGVFGVGESAGIIALVKEKKQRILLGDKVVGWMLQSIEGGTAIFVSNGKQQKLELQRAD